MANNNQLQHLRTSVMSKIQAQKGAGIEPVREHAGARPHRSGYCQRLAVEIARKGRAGPGHAALYPGVDDRVAGLAHPGIR